MAEKSFNIDIDRNLSVPLYQQLYDEFRSLIHSGELDGSQALPSERLLSARLDVSRATVRSCLMQLEKDGLVVRRRGAGTFVAQVPISQNLSRLTSFSDEMRARGLEPGAQLLLFERAIAVPEEALNLGLSPAGRVLRIKRLRTAGATPMAIELCVLPDAIAPDLTEADVAGRSLYQELKGRGIRLDRSIQYLRARGADAKAAEMLHIAKGAAILEIERKTWDDSNRVVEYVRSIYRGDAYDFVAELHANRDT